MPSTRQILASRANGARSRGPTSDAGKERSRMNALKHGLSSDSGVVFPDEMHEAIQTRTGELVSVLKPWDTFEVALVEQYATEEIRAAHCRLHQSALQELKAKGAVHFWDRDRRTAAEVMAGGLRKKPEVVSRQLKQTPQGADLLIARWEALLGTIRKNGEWDPAQRELALDLLGTSHVLRSGQTPLDPPDSSTPAAAWLSTLAEDQIRTLRASKPMLEEHDALEQEMAMHGLEPTPDSELNRLKRYESACMRRKQWAYDKLMGRKRSQWSNRPAQPIAMPMPIPVPADSAPEFPAHPTPEPEPISQPPRERAEAAAPEPDEHHKRKFLNHLQDLERSSEAWFQRARDELARAAAPPAAPEPPRASEVVSPAPQPQFQGNRRARRAAARRARQSG